MHSYMITLVLMNVNTSVTLIRYAGIAQPLIKRGPYKDLKNSYASYELFALVYTQPCPDPGSFLCRQRALKRYIIFLLKLVKQNHIFGWEVFNEPINALTDNGPVAYHFCAPN